MNDGNFGTPDRPLSVQETIDRLMAIEDKSQPLEINVWTDDFGVDYEKITLREQVSTTGIANAEIGIWMGENNTSFLDNHQVMVSLDEATIRAISYLKEPSSGKKLSDTQVIQALADDLGMTNSRPGSWEGSNMQAVIDGHGWESNNG